MEKITYYPCLVLTFAIPLIVIVSSVNGQSSPICTGPMISSFNSPCMNFLSTGSNSSSPTQNCCNSLKSLMSNGQDCLCLIITGGVPFSVPINRNLAMSLPRACQMSGVPIQCKGQQDPGDDAPTMSPGLSLPSPRAPLFPQPSPPPSLAPVEGDTMPTLTPPGMRPTLTTFAAAAHRSRSALPSLVVMLGVIFLEF